MIRALIAALLFSTPALAQDAPEIWARLPEPVTNNAVAGIELDGRMMAYSFAGLHAGKTWRDVTADAYACDLTARECREIDGLPDGIGRLAAVAVTVREQIYIFGGYTVAEDHSERSTPKVWRFDPASETYTHITDMPVPVDDTVALPFQDRYIYLVSGWHDTDNVDLVQVYDVEEDRWFEATPFPGAPVFGHAGAMTEDGLLQICGGTRVVPPAASGERRSFQAIADCWLGQVADDLATIVWSEGLEVPDGAFYRGVAYPLYRALVFAGGTVNAYNYSGIGYNGEPSEPRSDFISFIPNPADDRVCEPPLLRIEQPEPVGSWSKHNGLNVMDIRGVAQWDYRGVTRTFVLGGMGSDQRVLDSVLEAPGLVMFAAPIIDPPIMCAHPEFQITAPD